MEQIEIHSKDYLVRWINAKPGHTITWTIQPHKRSINFGLFKHPGHLGGLAHTPSVGGLPNLSLQTGKNEEDKDEAAPAVVDKLLSIGLKQIVKLGRCDADKSTQGRYDVPTAEAGNYALVFDNTFSKSVSKTVTIFLFTYPTSCQAQIHFGAQTHHSQAMASAMALAPPITGKKSPRLKAKKQDSADSLTKASITQSVVPGITVPESLPSTISALEESGRIHTGVLQKRRRKKHQGYARRFFCLDYTSSTLSYYHDKNSSALRGAIPLALAAIGANARTREISIDSGAEIWHLRAGNKSDFDEWKAALEKASKILAAVATPIDELNIQSGFFSPTTGYGSDNQEWARLESILSRIAGTRDSIRRLCLETLSKPTNSSSPSGMPNEGNTEDYFKNTERRAFWKRTPSTPNSISTAFKRTVSGQVSPAPPSTSDPGIANATSPFLNPVGNRGPYHRHQHEEGMHDHMKALLIDLDKVIYDFSAVVAENKMRRTIPRSAVSRLSLQSVDSQEFFDAEDRNPQLLAIPDESESENEDKDEIDSETSSDIEDGSFVATTRGARSGSLSSLLPGKPKTLIPLPHDVVSRRNIVKAPTIMPPSLIGFLRKNVGKDLSTISMPVSANEPLSLLQRAAEALEYATLLEKAVKTSEQYERFLYVSAFVISQLSVLRVKERSIRKPFNPMLGETFELVREDLNFRYVSEKVSHRPVQLACHAESNEWSYAQSPVPSQKFWGKSSEIITDGKARLVLHTPGECYSWASPTCFLRNIIAGEKYVEPVGSMTILNETTGSKATINFKAKGMFSGRSEEVDVQLFDANGVEQPIGLAGTWTSGLNVKEGGKVDTSRAIWSVGPLVQKPEKHYGLTVFAAEMNEITQLEEDRLPPTDSRHRPDQRALEEGDHEQAEALKTTLEEAQRSRRRDMEASGEDWKPRWFTRVENGDEIVWKLRAGHGGYWDERAKGEWKDVVDVLAIKQ